MAETSAKLATIAMIAVCPQLNPIPMPTRKKPNSDQPAKMTHLVSSMFPASCCDIAQGTTRLSLGRALIDPGWKAAAATVVTDWGGDLSDLSVVDAVRPPSFAASALEGWIQTAKTASASAPPEPSLPPLQVERE